MCFHANISYKVKTQPVTIYLATKPVIQSSADSIATKMSSVIHPLELNQIKVGGKTDTVSKDKGKIIFIPYHC